MATLSAKRELALAALDPDTDIDQVDMQAGIEELKQRLEVLLGAKPEAAADASQHQRELEAATRQQRVGEAGGQLLAAACGFLNELLPQAEDTAQTRALAQTLETRLGKSLQVSSDGRVQLTFTLPDREALTSLSRTLARLISLDDPL